MSKYRKKPVVIEAVQYLDTKEGIADVYRFVGSGLDMRPSTKNPDMTCLVISTLEGDHEADPGDWLIQGIKGEFYPCKPDIFEATYDLVED